ncbi:hypothetical protein [Caballeronia grimmiae]|uniref:hypothetical protein n=1 Tax=Caballeronia grimmiae TaxID=1071679 RepID=UPI0038BC61BF
MPFTAKLDEVRRMISEVGADLSDDFRYRNEILAPVEVWGLERFEGNCIVVKGQIKTRPLQQWSVARAFNERLTLKMEDAGIEMLLPQMQLYASPKEREARTQPKLRVLRNSP